MINKKTYLTLAVSSLLFCAYTADAQNGYQLLASIPNVPGVRPTLVTYLKGMYTTVVGLAMVFSVLMIVVGGTEYTLAVVPSGKESGKKKIMGAIYGLLLVLISAIVLKTINPALLQTGLNLQKIEVVPIQSGGGGGGGGTSGGTSGGTTKPTGAGGSEDANRQFLSDTGHISFNTDDPTRTQMANVNPGTLEEVRNIQEECGCDIVVTGGSESGYHSEGGDYSHVKGYKVDLRPSTELDNYITSQYTPSGTRSDGAKLYTAPSGAVYAKEGDHWDVLQKS